MCLIHPLSISTRPKRSWQSRFTSTHLPGLHLLRPPAEGHIGVVVGGAIPLLQLDQWDERRPPAVLPLPHPVVIHRLEEVVILVQQHLGLRERHKLHNTSLEQESKRLWPGNQLHTHSCGEIQEYREMPACHAPGEIIVQILIKK